MINHPQNQQVTAQQQHSRAANTQQQYQGKQPQGGNNQRQQFGAQGQGGKITHDQMMLINSMQAIMGGNVHSRSNSAKKHQGKKEEKKRLPSLHIGNLPSKFYDLDLFKLIKT